MTDKRLLDEVRSNLGGPPRRLGALTRFFLRAWAPLWVTVGDEDDGAVLFVRSFLEWQHDLLREGWVVWGHLVQANELLFAPGRHDHPALVIYGADSSLDDEVPWLREVAHRIFELKNTEPDDPELKRVAEILTDERVRGLPKPVPKSLTDGRDLWMASVFCVRKHLPGRVLHSSWVPLLTYRKTPNVMIVPERFWPTELMTRWFVDA